MIADGMVVSLNYTLKNDAGEMLDQSDGEALVYLHGADNIVPGLERKLTGRKVGDKLDVVVEPSDGYGERDPRAVQDIPREAFPPDAPIALGASFGVRTPDGQPMQLWITKLEGDTVTCDANHPLSGVRLHFSVEVTDIRAATDDEKAHGHPHGPDGHHHH